MSFELNQQATITILKGRTCTIIYEGNNKFIFLKDEKQIDNSHQMVTLREKQDKYTLEIENISQNMIAILPIDGNNGTFKSYSPPVKDEELFKYNWIGNFKTKKVETKKAGACDVLLVGEQGLYFFEFKTEAFEQIPSNIFDEDILILANQHLDKAEKQLARTITFFREQATEKNIVLDAGFYAIIVTLATFPRINASLVNRAMRFYALFSAILEEVDSDKTYSINKVQ